MMSSYPFRFISFWYRLASLILILIPAAAVCLVTWNGLKAFVLEQADRECRANAGCLLNIVRSRYDLVQNYLFQNEEHRQKLLIVVADVLQRIARELELESARRNLNASRAREMFVSLVTDISDQHEFRIILISDTGKIMYCSMLPQGFDVSEYSWVRTMTENEYGHFQFTWGYPGDLAPRDRIMVYRRIQGWNTILAVEAALPDALSSEFSNRQYQGLFEFIKGYHGPSGGFAMIFSAVDKSIIAHPEGSSGNLDSIGGAAKMIAMRNGNVTYEDELGFRWRSGIAYFAPRQWIVAVTAREDQILQNARSLVYKVLIVAGILALTVGAAFYRLQRIMLVAFLSRMRHSTTEK